jgi:oxygen-independent coproporphyrinogen-3 oxidase
MNDIHKSELIDAARSRVDDFRRLVAAGLLAKDGDFFPSVHYPPITMYKPIDQAAMFEGYRPRDGLFDVYAHIPFCHRRCLFCHYPGKFGEHQGAEKEKYLDALEREMDLYMRQLGVDRIKVRSILVGGGTPTFLTPKQLERFLKYFTRRLDTSHLRQFNYDVDPATLIGPEGLERLKIMRDYGVDRLTIGVQSLDEGILRLMNRPHDVGEAVESIDTSLKLGYQVNIEFIFGHPGETLDNWIEVMEKAVTLGVEEIQLYRLKVEAYGDAQGTIKKFKRIRPEDCPSPEEGLIMKQLAILILAQHGYRENLRRVFSKSRKHFSVYAHNQCCLLRDEIGLGLTAFSSLHDRFVLNTQHFDEYYRCIEEGRLPLNRGIVRDKEQQLRWSIILPLKNRDVKRGYFQRVTGESLDNVFLAKRRKLKEFGLIEDDAIGMRLTPLGAFFADEVAEQFHHPDYVPYPPENYERGPLFPYNDCAPYG